MKPSLTKGLSIGQEVQAVFRSSECEDGLRYVKFVEQASALPLLTGLAVGWLPATVLEDFSLDRFKNEDRDTWVKVRFTAPFRDARRGARESLIMNVHPDSVVTSPKDKPELLLSLVCLRWWDYSATMFSDSLSDDFITSLLHGLTGLDMLLRNEYEVHFVFVKSSADLSLVNGFSVRKLLSAPNISAFYFLVPAKNTDDSKMKPGCVCETKFFAMCQRMERAQIPSGWPNPIHMYKILVGKLWVPQMCLQKDYKVPATTHVHYADFADAPQRTAERALECLQDLRKHAGFHIDVPADQLTGVAKLGFNSDNHGISAFRGVDSLVQALDKLMRQPGSNQLVCIVQEMVLDVVCELRMECVYDAVSDSFIREQVWMSIEEEANHTLECCEECEVVKLPRATNIAVSEEIALQQFFFGCQDAKRKAEAQANDLVDWWALWYAAECPEPAHVMRLDFLVSYSQASKTPSLWISRFCEGSAHLTSVAASRSITALLNGIVQRDASGRFPLALPVAAGLNGGLHSNEGLRSIESP